MTVGGTNSFLNDLTGHDRVENSVVRRERIDAAVGIEKYWANNHADDFRA
jgi:hypothetical protein